MLTHNLRSRALARAGFPRRPPNPHQSAVLQAGRRPLGGPVLVPAGVQEREKTGAWVGRLKLPLTRAFLAIGHKVLSGAMGRSSGGTAPNRPVRALAPVSLTNAENLDVGTIFDGLE